jgi:serine/threonine-protein kinase HipA
MAFQYTEDWLETQGSRPVSLSLPLNYQGYEGERVYNFFNNLALSNHSGGRKIFSEPGKAYRPGFSLRIS